MTCICFSQLFMKLCVYFSRFVARRNKNMLLDLVKNYKEQGFQLKGNRESYHLMFKISKISLSPNSCTNSLFHQKIDSHLSSMSPCLIPQVPHIKKWYHKQFLERFYKKGRLMHVILGA